VRTVRPVTGSRDVFGSGADMTTTIMSNRIVAPMSAGQCHQLLLGGRWCSIRWRTFGAEFQLNGMVKVVQFPPDCDGDEQEQKKSALGMALAERIVGLRGVRSRSYLHQSSEGGVVLTISCYLRNRFAIT
jgi:hypothetical protein